MKTLKVLRKLDKDTRAKVYLVGGFVRDFLRNKQNKDLDIVIRNYSLKKIIEYLSNYGKVKRVKLSQTNDKFGVSIVLFKAHGDNTEAQISLPKKGQKQNQHPKNSLKDDMKHRDFTINAMYLPINFKSKKDIVDMAGGRLSIYQRRLFTVGNPLDRINESPIRIMRALSLSARTGYTIDPFVLETMRHRARLLYKVPIENIRDEINKILLSKKPSKQFKVMAKLGILKLFMPELDGCRKIRQDHRYHKWDVFKHSIYTADNISPNLVLRLAGLLHDIGKPEVRETKAGGDGEGTRTTFHKHEIAGAKRADLILTRMQYDTATKKAVLKLIKNHMYHYLGNVYYCTFEDKKNGLGCGWKKAAVKTIAVPTKCPLCGSKLTLKNGWTDGAIRRFIDKMHITQADLEDLDGVPLFRLRRAERKGNGLKTIPVTDRQKDFQKRITEVFEAGSVFRIADLDIDGTALMETFKLKQSPKVGRVLSHLLDQVLEKPELNNKLDLLKLATEYFYHKKFI